MAGMLPEMKFMSVTPALTAYRAGVDDYRADQDYAQKQEQRSLLKQVGQTAATQGLGAAGAQAMAGGDIATGIKLQDLSLDRQAKLYDFMGRGAAAADTPEKWQAYISTLAKTFGPESVKGFEDFRTRESAVLLSMNAKEQAEMALRKQALTESAEKNKQDQALRTRQLDIQERGLQGKPETRTIKNADGSQSLVRVNPDGSATPVAVPGATAQNPMATNIRGGLQNLDAMTEKYDNASFTNAVGPFQGSTPDGLLSAAPVNIARLGGEVLNLIQGGGSSPSEVRGNIQGGTEALAAALKPLIRKPGEGAWTDADQARLVSVVGDLPQARDKAEFKRRLKNVAERIESNFGIKVDFEPRPLAGEQKAEAAPKTIQSKAEYDKLNSGDIFVGSDGKRYRKP